MRLHAVAGVVAVTVLATGCATNSVGGALGILGDFAVLSGSGSGSLEQKALRRQAQRHRNYAKTRRRADTAGAMLGSIGGTLSDRDRPRGAELGGVAGGTVGYIGATYLTRDHSQFVASRKTLRQDVKAATEETANSLENVRLAEAALAYQRGEADRLNAAYAAGETSAEQYERSLETFAEDRASVRSMIATTEERTSRMRAAIAASREAGLDPAQLEESDAVQARHLVSLRKIEGAMVDLVAGAPEGVKRPSDA